MRTVTHHQHQKDYDAGWSDMMEFINSAGLDAAKLKNGAENPHGTKFSNLGAYYYASGEIDAIVSKM